MIWCSTHCCQSDALRIVVNVCDWCHCRRMSKEIQHQARISSASRRSPWNADAGCSSQKRSEFVAARRSNISTAVLRSDALSKCESHQCKESFLWLSIMHFKWRSSLKWHFWHKSHKKTLTPSYPWGYEGVQGLLMRFIPKMLFVGGRVYKNAKIPKRTYIAYLT